MKHTSSLSKKAALLLFSVVVLLPGVVPMVRGQCLIPPAGLVAWWPGDGDANDIQGPTFENGTNQPGTSFGAGKVAQAFDFNGASSGVVIGNPLNLRLTNEITLDAWVNPRSIPAGNSFGLAGVITKWVVSTATESWGLWLFRNGSAINVASDFGDGASGSVLFGGNVPTNQWSHIATSYNSATDEHKIYVNGVQVGSRLLPGAIVTSDIPVVIGNQATANVPFDGLIDEVEIFNRALSGTEITAIYNADATGQCKPALQPRLNIHPSANTNVVLSWATNFTDFTLEANTNLDTTGWSVVSPPPVVSGTNNVVTNILSGPARFYRLRK